MELKKFMNDYNLTVFNAVKGRISLTASLDSVRQIDRQAILEVEYGENRFSVALTRVGDDIGDGRLSRFNSVTLFLQEEIDLDAAMKVVVS